MSDRDAHRFDHLSDGHLADKAAFGDSEAFVALAQRFHDRVWTVAALAALDEGTATRATARAFTRTLAGVAAGIGDPDTCVERALVTAAFELAVTARIEQTDLVDRVPAALREEAPATRVALWLTAHGWSQAAALAAVTIDTIGSFPALDTATPDARGAVDALDLHAPAGLAAATADAWHEWQGIGLTIPDRHPLTTVLARLDAPLGRVGDALGRVGSRTTARRRRARATATATATPPPPVLLPVGAEREDTTEAAEAEAVDAEVVAPAAPVAPASEVFLGPRTEDLTLPERRERPAARQLVTAGASPTRTRVLAALAAGILTASAVGSLLTTTPADAPARADQVAVGAPTPSGGGEGTLLDDDDLVPAANVTDAPADEDGAPSPGSPITRSTAGPSGATTSGAPRATSRPAAGTGGSTSSGAPAAGAPAAAASGSGGSAAGGTGTGGSAPVAPTTSPAPPATITPPPATTAPAPPPTTTAPPPPSTTTPPTTQPQGPVCTVLPILCPGGGLVP